MELRRPRTALPRRLALALARAGALALALAGLFGAAAASAADARAANLPASRRMATVSANWAGYTATGADGGQQSFRNVTGEWTQPAVSCSGGRAYSGFWVGLGGFERKSSALEQIGTEADCTSAGTASYFAWYELVPKAPVELRLKISPGDRVAAAVHVSGHRVTLSLRDLSSGAHATRTERPATVDTSSAEWIAEAPSECVSSERCAVLPLANFASVTFSDATATSASGLTGAIADSGWSAKALELQDLDAGFGPGRFARSATTSTAVPSALSEAGSAFVVTDQQASAPSQAPEPVGPFGAAPPE